MIGVHRRYSATHIRAGRSSLLATLPLRARWIRAHARDFVIPQYTGTSWARDASFATKPMSAGCADSRQRGPTRLQRLLAGADVAHRDMGLVAALVRVDVT